MIFLLQELGLHTCHHIGQEHRLGPCGYSAAAQVSAWQVGAHEFYPQHHHQQQQKTTQTWVGNTCIQMPNFPHDNNETLGRHFTFQVQFSHLKNGGGALLLGIVCCLELWVFYRRNSWPLLILPSFPRIWYIHFKNSNRKICMYCFTKISKTLLGEKMSLKTIV